jgi:hypothetical protein
MIATITNADLVDIRDIRMDANLSKLERIAEYVRQIKDPYHFKCDEFTVSVKYADNGVKFEDCLKRIVGRQHCIF